LEDRLQIETAALAVAFLTVVIAEMGDKTQLLAMAFALKYKWWKVMMGVLVATVLNHALAVALGTLLGKIESAHAVIQVLASASFIGFGLWTLKGDELGDEAKKPSRFGPVLTVAIAFFLAEIGDKTQLATIALSAKYPASPLGVLSGTTLGMVVADGFGIIVGVVLCKKIPERAVKIAAAAAFAVFGIVSSFQLFMEELAMGLALSLACAGAMSAVTAALGWLIYRRSLRAPKPDVFGAACSGEEAGGGPS
jgi:putative Ca2+/H+ antiporter (TMEM165/GDT1 family)